MAIAARITVTVVATDYDWRVDFAIGKRRFRLSHSANEYEEAARLAGQLVASLRKAGVKDVLLQGATHDRAGSER